MLVGNYDSAPTTVKKIAIVEKSGEQPVVTTTTTAKPATTTTTTTAAPTTTTQEPAAITTTMPVTTAPIPGYDKITFTDTINAVYNNGQTNIVQFAQNGEYSVSDFILSSTSELKAGNNVSIDFFGVYGTPGAIYNINSISLEGSGDITYGDANNDGDISVSDPTLIMQYLANPSNFKITNQKAADVEGNNDGVTSQDALTIQKFLAGTIKQLPAA